MKRSDIIRTLSWAVPVVCFVLAGGLVYWQFKKLRTAEEQLQVAKRDKATIEQQIADFQSAGGSERIPFVYDSRLEESMFLDGIRRLALANKVSLDKYANESQAAAPPDPNQPAAMANVKTLISALEVRGSYDAVRSFMNQLLSSKRLLAVKMGTWGRTKSGTTFSFTLHRYVSTAPPPAPPKLATRADGNSGGISQ